MVLDQANADLMHYQENDFSHMDVLTRAKMPLFPFMQKSKLAEQYQEIISFFNNFVSLGRALPDLTQLHQQQELRMNNTRGSTTSGGKDLSKLFWV